MTAGTPVGVTARIDVLAGANRPDGYLVVHDEAGVELSREPLAQPDYDLVDGVFAAGAVQVTADRCAVPPGMPLRVSLYDAAGELADTAAVEVAPPVDPEWSAFGRLVRRGANLTLVERAFGEDQVAREAARLLDLVARAIEHGVELPGGRGFTAERVTRLANALAARLRAFEAEHGQGDQG